MALAGHVNRYLTMPAVKVRLRSVDRAEGLIGRCLRLADGGDRYVSAASGCQCCFMFRFWQQTGGSGGKEAQARLVQKSLAVRVTHEPRTAMPDFRAWKETLSSGWNRDSEEEIEPWLCAEGGDPHGRPTL